MNSRTAQIDRATGETQISLKLKIDGKGESSIETGIPFFNHMLSLFAKHSVCDLHIKCKGDLDVDFHHSVEDVGIALGQAYWQALGEKRGIKRYGTGFDPRNPLWGEAHLPMDETLSRAVVDFSGRPFLIWNGMDKLAFKMSKREAEQDDACRFRFGLAREFFQGFCNEARCNLHVELLYGQEPHHVVESLFKAFAKAVDIACQKDPRIGRSVPSTKGRLRG
jgi:imidazoleglycerol-phosphate dehydratase